MPDCLEYKKAKKASAIFWRNKDLNILFIRLQLLLCLEAKKSKRVEGPTSLQTQRLQSS